MFQYLLSYIMYYQLVVQYAVYILIEIHLPRICFIVSTFQETSVLFLFIVICIHIENINTVL